MFWRIASNNRKSLSLVKQMIMLYSLTTIIIVAFVCMILFPTFEKVTHINNLSYHDNLFSQCIIKLIVAILFSIISAILFSSLITKKILNPISRLSDQIKNTTINSLDTKIILANLPQELQPLADSYNIMLDKLKYSFNQISQFSSDIAHELRNPLNNLLGINEVAITHQYSLEKHRAVCESTLEECRYLIKLIENLLFIAQSERGDFTIKGNLINCKNEILNILSYYEPYANEHNIYLSCEGYAMLNADAILFKHAISNLLSNAIRHTHKNGKIVIQITPSQEYLTIGVNDNGCGIPETHLPKLFDRFYRVDASRSSQTGGLGLGLSIVKSIMDLHKGTVHVQSAVNVGTTVFLNFPTITC